MIMGHTPTYSIWQPDEQLMLDGLQLRVAPFRRDPKLGVFGRQTLKEAGLRRGMPPTLPLSGSSFKLVY